MKIKGINFEGQLVDTEPGSCDHVRFALTVQLQNLEQSLVSFTLSYLEELNSHLADFIRTHTKGDL